MYQTLNDSAVCPEAKEKRCCYHSRRSDAATTPGEIINSSFLYFVQNFSEVLK